MDARIKTLYLLLSWGISSRFPVKRFTHVALKKDLLLDCEAFSLKIGASSKLPGRLPVLRIAHNWKTFYDIFCFKKMLNSTLSQNCLQMCIRSAMMKIYAKHSSGGTRLWWRRWNELRTRRN